MDCNSLGFAISDSGQGQFNRIRGCYFFYSSSKALLHYIVRWVWGLKQSHCVEEWMHIRLG